MAYGSKFDLTGSVTVQAIFKELAKSELGLRRVAIKPTGVVVDIGANAGNPCYLSG